jgi:apolipoprotein N-acyltransferase
VPATHDPTLYLRFGDWFAWVALAGLALALVQLVRLRSHAAQPRRANVQMMITKSP